MFGNYPAARWSFKNQNCVADISAARYRLSTLGLGPNFKALSYEHLYYPPLSDLPSLSHLVGDSGILESLIISLPHEENLKKSPTFLVFYLQHSSVGSATGQKKLTNYLDTCRLICVAQLSKSALNTVLVSRFS
jgi:hypothetical protein